MLNIFTLKKTAGQVGEGGRTSNPTKKGAAHLRVQKGRCFFPILLQPPLAHVYVYFLSTTDINELNLPKTCHMDFPDPDDLLKFVLYISPDEVSIDRDIWLLRLFVWNKVPSIDANV